MYNGFTTIKKLMPQNFYHFTNSLMPFNMKQKGVKHIFCIFEFFHLFLTHKLLGLYVQYCCTF